MKAVKNIIFRNVTDADFFNINKKSGAETGGGGQAYIDFPVASVSILDWKNFFSGVKGITETAATQGPAWTFPIHSIGIDSQQKNLQSVKIYQRRAASVSVASQKIHSSRANRIQSWHPENGFPKPLDSSSRNQCPEGLMVFLVSTFNNEIWAGWFLNNSKSILPILGEVTDERLKNMVSPSSSKNGYSEFLTFKEGELTLDELNKDTPFHSSVIPLELPPKNEADKEAIEEEDSDILFNEDYLNDSNDIEIEERVVKTRKRNTKIVRSLKNLYNHKCQITGDEYTFLKRNGENYTEAHHLVPLGIGGSDNPQNLVILSPLVHSMFHHAKISPIDINDITIDTHGRGFLEITINDKPYTIEWHPKHAKLFN